MKWLAIARNKILHRIEQSIANDKHEIVLKSLSNVKFTALSLDISNCFNQMSQFWRRLGNEKKLIEKFSQSNYLNLAWPEIISSIIYSIKIIEDMAYVTRRYTTLAEEKLNAKQLYETKTRSCSIQEVNSSFFCHLFIYFFNLLLYRFR